MGFKSRGYTPEQEAMLAKAQAILEANVTPVFAKKTPEELLGAQTFKGRKSIPDEVEFTWETPIILDENA